MWKSKWRFFSTKVLCKRGRSGNNVYFIPGPLRHVSLGCHSHANSPRPANPLYISHNWNLSIQSVDVLTARVPIIVAQPSYRGRETVLVSYRPYAAVKYAWKTCGLLPLAMDNGAALANHCG
ncbi:hypothetical protein HBI56_078530 [Parastagonospora nodorum]|nr:hypothetical protein HBI06_116480 [Parastagonospora nodorum]KAH4247039.1 hypothetical protein HBI05_039990 [Parastagonospora nodorum]KAH6525230.1 hypothetical protein HBI56_078530 [Parastagonospora nodorum]